MPLQAFTRKADAQTAAPGAWVSAVLGWHKINLGARTIDKRTFGCLTIFRAGQTSSLTRDEDIRDHSAGTTKP